MIIIRYLFAILLTIPIIMLGIYLVSQFVELTMGSGEKRRRSGGRTSGSGAKGFTIRMPEGSGESPEEREAGENG